MYGKICLPELNPKIHVCTVWNNKNLNLHQMQSYAINLRVYILFLVVCLIVFAEMVY